METFKVIATPKQREAHKALQENTIVLFGGAIRGSKSHWGCMEIITLCLKYPRSRWLMCRESWGNIKTKLLVTFTENFLNNGLDSYVDNFNKDTFILTFYNGSQIVFMAESYDNDKELNKFRGLEINGAFIDEVNEIQEVTFDKIIERSGSWFHSPNCPTKILMSCNPTNNWVKNRFYNKWKTNTLPKGIAYVPAKITDNPYVPKEYVESLKLLPTYQYEVFVNGNWDIQLKVGGEAYKCFELDKHVFDVKYNPNLPIHISWDDNVNPYLPCNIWQIDGKKAICIDEIALEDPHNRVESVCNEIKRKYHSHSAGVFIYGDATAQKEDTKLEKGMNFFRLITGYLKDYRPSLRVAKSNPNVKDRLDWINTVLEKNYNGIEILINRECQKTINDLILTKEDMNGGKFKEMDTNPTTKVRYQKVGHMSDCMDYVLTTLFVHDFETWKRSGMNFKPTSIKGFSTSNKHY